MNKALKITDNNEYELSAKDIAAIHYGYCLTYGKVAYTTGIAFDNTKNLEHILLVVGDEKPVFYWCHVEKFYSYGSGPKGIEKSMDEYSPEIYKVSLILHGCCLIRWSIFRRILQMSCTTSLICSVN